MPPSGTTARRKLPFIKPTDAPKLSELSELLANALDNDVEVKTGKLSERPASSLFGRLFYVQGDTAANNGITWIDLGASWTVVATPSGAGQSYSVTSKVLTEGASYSHEYSSSRGAQVLVYIQPSGGSSSLVIKIGGVEVMPAISLEATATLQLPLFIPAGQTLSVARLAGVNFSLWTSAVLL